jgi:hypothetical protein
MHGQPAGKGVPEMEWGRATQGGPMHVLSTTQTGCGGITVAGCTQGANAVGRARPSAGGGVPLVQAQQAPVVAAGRRQLGLRLLLLLLLLLLSLARRGSDDRLHLRQQKVDLGRRRRRLRLRGRGALAGRAHGPAGLEERQDRTGHGARRGRAPSAVGRGAGARWAAACMRETPGSLQCRSGLVAARCPYLRPLSPPADEQRKRAPTSPRRRWGRDAWRRWPPRSARAPGTAPSRPRASPHPARPRRRSRRPPRRAAAAASARRARRRRRRRRPAARPASPRGWAAAAAGPAAPRRRCPE